MVFAPSPIGKKMLDEESLKKDLKECRKFGPCGVGKLALYLGGRYLDRRYYVPWKEVKRVFKRVAMSQGGFTGKGMFGSMAFLVVQLGGGTEKECPFKFEADVDRLLACVEQEHPDIPTHSVKAQNKLAKAEAEEEIRPSLCDALVNSAKQKRVVDNLSPVHRVIGAALGFLGIAAALYGVYGLIVGSPYALYFIIGGGAAFFMALSSNTFPGKYNSKKYAQLQWQGAVSAMRDYLKGRPSVDVPPQYAHPVVLTRMIRVLREGRAQSSGEALDVVKQDLRALNSSVKVSQKEYDEVVAVKPLFLVCDYQNEI